MCSFDRWHVVTVKRKNGALYTTLFYACSQCPVMLLGAAVQARAALRTVD